MALNIPHFSNVLITNLVCGLSDHAAKLLTINEINQITNIQLYCTVELYFYSPYGPYGL
jgi:hypothetical protein